MRVSGSTTEMLVPLNVSALNLRERTAPYQEVLAIDVRSASYEAVGNSQLLEIALTVQAATSFAVWGRITWDVHQEQRCELSMR